MPTTSPCPEQVREAEAEAFAEGAALPIVAENCPACFDAPKERYRVKCLLATQEAAFPMLFQSLTTIGVLACHDLQPAYP